MASATVPHGQTSTSKPSSMQDCLPQFQKDLAKAESKHGERCRRYDTFDDIYNGRLSAKNGISSLQQTEEGDWRSALHPQYAFETIQTELAMLLDDQPIASVKPPRGKPNLKDKAQAYENLLNEQRRADNYSQKQARNHLNALLYGIGIIKNAWSYDRANIRTQILTPVYGQMPEREIVEKDKTITDRPTIIVCNPRNVMWNPDAESDDEITTLIFRTYETKASLKGIGVYENLDDVAAGNGQGAWNDRPGARDLRDMVEVLERWQLREEGVQLTVVANRNIVIRDCPSPYLLDGKQIPFSFVIPTPQPGRVEGKSECELIGEQQAARWRIENQMMDAGDMILEPPLFMKDNIEDPDSIIWATGKKNFLPNQGGPLSDQIWMPAMPTALLTAGESLLQLLKDDMADVTGVSSYLTGAESSQVDPRTATEVQNVTQSGQRRVLMKKQHFADQERQIGTFQLQLNEQLAPDVIPAYGSNGEPMPLRISDIIGCTYEVEDADESLNRQERRTEANQNMTLLGSLAAIPQIGMMLNWKAILEDYFEAYDIDPESMLLDAPPVPQGAPMAPGGLASAPVAGGAPLAAVPTTPQFGAGAASTYPVGVA